MNPAAKFDDGLTYAAFLDRYATPEQRRRWDAVHQRMRLTDAQKELLRSFRREMNVLVLAGAWCGDCINQCPIFDRFAAENERIQVRYFDRDGHDDLATDLAICGGKRVPAVLFLSEDGHVCGRYGDRTISKYRQLVRSLDGAACPTGLVPDDANLLAAVTQDWLDEFERIAHMLRTSGRLRQKHGD
ncbi:MAG: thioredoxin family protein [Planctomycetaceae bacterium]